MFKKVVTLAVFLLAVASLVSGCGKKSDNGVPAVDNGLVSENQAENKITTGQSDTVDNPSGEYTINELLAMRKPMKCSWKESANQDREVTNIIYLNNPKFYQEVTMGDMGHVYTVSDGEYLYIWNDFSEMASKINIKEAESQSQSGQPSSANAANLEQRRDFVCEKWSVDNSVFNPPADKNFQDITEEMVGVTNDLMENADKYKQQACDMCRKAPTEELRNECLTNAGCN